MIRVDQTYNCTTGEYRLNGKITSTVSKYKRWGYRLTDTKFLWPYSYGPMVAPKALAVWSK
mgnify:CR=1 FL=1